MRRTATSASRYAPRRSLLSRVIASVWRGADPAAAGETRTRARFEEIEPRILLSGDFAPGAPEAMAAGLEQFGTRLEQFFTENDTLAQRVPLLLRVTADEQNDTLISEAPTVSDLLSVPVDANGDGHVNGGIPFPDGFFDDDHELVLEDLDTGIVDGVVDAGEFLSAWFFDEVVGFLEDFEPADTATFKAFLEGFGFGFGQTLNQLGPYGVVFEVTGVSDTTENPDAEATFALTLELTVTNSMPIDLGLEADGLKLFAYEGASLNPQSVKVPVESKLTFTFEFGVFTGGQDESQINAGDFFVRRAEPLLVSVVAKDTDLDFNLNVGFLGAEVVNGIFDLQVDVASALVDPNDPAALGFEDSQHGVEQAGGVVTAANAVPSASLDHDVGFFLRIGNVGITKPVFVSADPGVDTINELKAHVQAAIASAGLGSLITVDIDGSNKLSFALPGTTDTPLDFANEAYAANGILQVAPGSFEFAEDQAFLLSLAGALPKLVNVRFRNAAEEEIGFDPQQEAGLPNSADQIEALDPPSVFNITGDATFAIAVTANNGFHYANTITVAAGDVPAGADLADLRDAINSKLNADLNLAPFLEVVIVGSKLSFEGTNAALSAFRVDAGGTAVSEIGFAEAPQQATLRLTAANDAISSGDLSASATFRVDMLEVDAGSTTTRITVTPSNNGGVADLAADVDAALAAAGLGGDLDAVAEGNRVVLVAKHVKVASFSVTSENESVEDLAHDVNAALADAGFGGQVTASHAGGGVLRLASAGGESLEITRTLTFDAGVTYAELLGSGELFAPEVDEAASHATLDLPVKVKAGLEDLQTGADDDWNPQDVAIVANFSPLGSTVAEFDPALQRFTLHFALTPETSVPEQDSPVGAVTSGDLDEAARLVNMAELLNFNLLNAENMVGLLTGLGSALQQITGSDGYANYDIPFADAKLSDLFNFVDPDNETATGLIDQLLFYIGDHGLGDANGPDDDVNRLLRRVEEEDQFFLVPNFVTAQELANKLHEVLGVPLEGDGGINAAYDTESNELTYSVDLIAGEPTATTIEAPFEYDTDLSPFAKLTVDTDAQAAAKRVTLEGRTGLAMTFGVDLEPPGVVITGGTLLSKLNGENGVKIKREEAITGTVNVPVTRVDPKFPPSQFARVQQLHGDAVFEISVDGGPAVCVKVTQASVYQPSDPDVDPVDPDEVDDADGNRTMADLAEDVDAALALAGLDGDLYADYDGQRLVISARHSGVSFEIVSSNFYATNELGLQAGATSNTVDFVITDSTGDQHEIVLDGLAADATVQDVIDEINDQTGAAVTAKLNGAHTGLRLEDNTGGLGTFRIDSVNGASAVLGTGHGSSALLGLGFFLNNSVSSAFAEQDGNPHLIEGGGIGATHLDDRFFLRDAVMRLDGLSLETPDGGVPGSALFGIVGVDTTFDGSLVANVTGELNGGDTVTLAQLFDNPAVVDDAVVAKVQELSLGFGIGGFQPGQVLTGTASGATAVVVGTDGGTLLLANV